MAVSTSTALLIGAGASAASSLSAGRAAERQGEEQARISEEQAAREREIAAAEARDYQKSQSRVFAERRAALGGSGVETTTGTPVLAAEDFAAEVALQARRIREGGATRALRLEQQAGLSREAGRAARTTGIFRAGSSLLTGIGTASEFGFGSSGPGSHGGRDIRF